MATQFHLFPKLPQELRDAIWRECLPRRVIELDWPTEDSALDVPVQEVDDDGRYIHRDVSCLMTNTSMINAKPPIISRVCRESRRVAFETGALLEHPWEPEEPRLYHRIRKHWVDRARDTVVHLNFNTRSDDWLPDWKEHNGNPVQLLRDAMLPANGVRSMNKRFLSCMARKESKDVVESMSEVLVCLKVVVLHVDKEPAIQSGLFGRLGEDRIVMVDFCDDKRIREYRDFWRRHQRTQDKLTESFFQSCIVSEWRRAMLKAMESIKTRWLLDRWYDTTGWWVRETNAFGMAKWVRRIRSVPGLVQEEVWEKAGPVLHNRRLFIGAWVPNQQHPWVRATYSNMPRFVPAIMFRLCTNVCRT